MNLVMLASALAAAIVLSACAPNQPPPLASTPVASHSGGQIISGPAPMPSPGSMTDAAPDYTMVGRDPVPNFPETGEFRSPDDRPYGSY